MQLELNRIHITLKRMSEKPHTDPADIHILCEQISLITVVWPGREAMDLLCSLVSQL